MVEESAESRGLDLPDNTAPECERWAALAGQQTSRSAETETDALLGEGMPCCAEPYSYVSDQCSEVGAATKVEA